MLEYAMVKQRRKTLIDETLLNNKAIETSFHSLLACKLRFTFSITRNVKNVSMRLGNNVVHYKIKAIIIQLALEM